MAGYILQNIEKCDLCEGLHFTLYTEKDSFNIAKCVNCGLVCLDYVPKAEESKRLYTEPYFRNSDGTWSSKGYPDYFAIENILRKVFSKKLKKLMELKNSGLLLDIGCSAGFFLDVARQHFDVLGVDISDFAAEYGKKVFGIDIFTTPLEDC
ncbi:MAG: hypothetical protein KAR47_11700, partial [Planctomycetes bacterium]|nr:hypothetical protein [Planctomycetota bacterium]